MGYSDEKGKPFEYASKAAHSHIINDDEVKAYLSQCEIPVHVKNVNINPSLVHDIKYPSKNKIKYIIAVVGGFSTIPVRKAFPSSLLTFFQFGSLLIKTDDLDQLEEEQFISPEDISKLKNIERAKLVLPTRNIAQKKEESFAYNVREAIYTFFAKTDQDDDSLLQTLYWFIFAEYDKKNNEYHPITKCPVCGHKDSEEGLLLHKDQMSSDYTWHCVNCTRTIFLTDVFRLYEVIDEEMGALGILGYLTNTIESFILVHALRGVMNVSHGFCNEFCFIKDGPLSFAGQTATMQAPMRRMINALKKEHNINIVGIEKSGAFVDHAKEVQDLLDPGQLLLLSNEYIYTNILPGNPNSDQYATSSYYSGKMIFKTKESKIYVITIPIQDANLLNRPELSDYQNLNEILMNVDKLKCDIYENALLPVAIANKLVSLSNHPSSKILERFAKGSMK